MDPEPKPIDGFLLSCPDYERMTVGIDLHGIAWAIVSRDGEKGQIEFYKDDGTKSKPVLLNDLIAELIKARDELATEA